MYYVCTIAHDKDGTALTKDSNEDLLSFPKIHVPVDNINYAKQIAKAEQKKVDESTHNADDVEAHGTNVSKVLILKDVTNEQM